VTSFNTIWKSCFHLLPHSEGSKSTIIADKMKFAEQLIMMVLIKGYCWKNVPLSPKVLWRFNIE